jgi:hypothetical protein
MSKHKLPSSLMVEQVMKRDPDVLIWAGFGVTNQAIHFFIDNFPSGLNKTKLDGYSLALIPSIGLHPSLDK